MNEATDRLFLYLARHGETVWNTQNRMQGRGNSALTDRGLEGARALAHALADIPLLAAFTSPAPRAVETARLALAGRPVPLLVDERIQEMALGVYEGLTVTEAYALDRTNMEAFFHQADRFEPRSGEGFADVMERIARFLDELTADPLAMVQRRLAADPSAVRDDAAAPDVPVAPAFAALAGTGTDRHVLVISHNITVKTMLTIMRRRPLSRLREGRHIPQATLIPVLYEPQTGQYRLLPEAERILG